MEGGLQGSLSFLGGLMGMPEPEAAKLACIDDIGPGRVYFYITSACAWAPNAPFQWGKALPGYLGATSAPCAILLS